MERDSWIPFGVLWILYIKYIVVMILKVVMVVLDVDVTCKGESYIFCVVIAYYSIISPVDCNKFHYLIMLFCDNVLHWDRGVNFSAIGIRARMG